MRRLSIICLFLLCIGSSFAQQLPQHSQLMFNKFSINPGVAGSQHYFRAVSTNRYQWSGITDAPRTYVLNLYGPHRTQDMGFGGYVYNDVTGPTSSSGAMAAYAYNVKVTNDIKIGLGLSLGILQYKLDVSKIRFLEDQPNLTSELYTDYIPDAGFGAYLFTPKYFAGISANQLFGNRVKVYSSRKESDYRLSRHYYLMGGYRFDINDKFSVEPVALFKFVTIDLWQADISARVTYQKMVWLGGSYRYDDAASIMVGYNFNNQLFVGYSYDFITTGIKKHSTGTHEVMIGSTFSGIKKPQSEDIEETE